MTDHPAFPEAKILVVDDHRPSVALLQDIFSDISPAQVKVITDSRLALDACLSFQPDIVVLDLAMPHVDGLTLLQTIRADSRIASLPIVVLTADANSETRRRVVAAGATDFLLKPLNYDVVLFRVRNLLASRGKQLANVQPRAR